jgi:outer membrane lipoprotein-sorting protein
MRRTFGLALLATIAASATAFAVHQSSGSSLLATFGKALNDSKSVQATFTIRTVGGSGSNGSRMDISVTLKKPNLARVETPAQIVVMDGKTVTTFAKSDNTYYKHPETAADFNELMSDDALAIFGGFINPNAYQAPRSKPVAPLHANGALLTGVEATAAHKVTTYYLDPTDNVARKATTEFTNSTPAVSQLVNVSSIELNSNLPDSTFVFAAPDGSRELSADEISAGRWYTDLDQACKVAKSTGKKVFIDFMATWCGPCKMLAAECFGTDTFKSFGKKFVFCRIDVDEQPSLGSQYGASAIPLQVVADSSGGVIDKNVGYGGAEQFFGFLRKNAG